MRPKKFLRFGIFILLMIPYVFIKTQLDERLKTRSAVDIRYLPTPNVAKTLSFGFEPAMADIYWIEAINYFGENLMKKDRNYKYLEPYSNLIFGLDPFFVAFYDWVGTAFIYNGFPINRDGVIKSTEYLNYGIKKLNEVYRYDRDTIVKAAFNYAVETKYRLPSVGYFAMAGRIFPSDRDMLLIGSTYAFLSKDYATSSQLKLEYLGMMAFEANTKDKILYALKVLSSPRMNVQAGEFVKAMRVKMESDEEIKKLVAERLNEDHLRQSEDEASSSLPADIRIQNAMELDHTRTWLPPDMLALFSI